MQQQQPSGVEFGPGVGSRLGCEDIGEVHKRRYLLQPNSLEIFSNDDRIHQQLAFPPNVRLEIYQRLLAEPEAGG